MLPSYSAIRRGCYPPPVYARVQVIGAADLLVVAVRQLALHGAPKANRASRSLMTMATHGHLVPALKPRQASFQ